MYGSETEIPDVGRWNSVRPFSSKDGRLLIALIGG